MRNIYKSFFSKNTNAEDFWNSDNYRIFSVKYHEDKNIILSSSNKTNLNLMSLNETDIGKCFEDFADYPNYYFLKNKIFAIKKIKHEFSYIITCPFDNSCWNMSVEIIGNTGYFVGKLLDKGEKENINVHEFEFVNYLNIDSNFICNLMIKKINNEFRYIYEENIVKENDVCNILIKNGIDFLYETTNHSITPDILNYCLDNKKTIYFKQQMQFSDRYILKFSVLPLSGFIDCLLLIVKRICTNSFWDDYLHLHFENLIDSENHAICIINPDSDFKIEITNSCFDTFSHIHKFKLDDLLEHSVFKSCISQRIAQIGIITLNNCSKNKPEQYYVNAIPLFKYNKLCKVLVDFSICQSQKSTLEKLNNNLTEREKEILLLVAQGNTNKSISVSLKISEGTVKRIIYNAYQKLKINSRIELTRLLSN